MLINPIRHSRFLFKKIGQCVAKFVNEVTWFIVFFLHSVLIWLPSMGGKAVVDVVENYHYTYQGLEVRATKVRVKIKVAPCDWFLGYGNHLKLSPLPSHAVITNYIVSLVKHNM